MVDVNFEEEQTWQRPTPEETAGSGSGITARLIKMGIAKNSSQANYILIGVVLVIVAIAIVVFLYM